MTWNDIAVPTSKIQNRRSRDSFLDSILLFKTWEGPSSHSQKDIRSGSRRTGALTPKRGKPFERNRADASGEFWAYSPTLGVARYYARSFLIFRQTLLFSPADARANVDARYARQLDFDRHVRRHPRDRDSPGTSLSDDFSSYKKKRSIGILSGERGGRVYSRHDISVQMKQDRCGRLIHEIALRSKKL